MSKSGLWADGRHQRDQGGPGRRKRGILGCGNVNKRDSGPTVNRCPPMLHVCVKDLRVQGFDVLHSYQVVAK